VPETVADMTAAGLACAFARRLLGLEDPGEILDVLCDTAVERFGTRDVAVTVEGTGLQRAGSPLAAALEDPAGQAPPGVLCHGVATSWPGRLRLLVVLPDPDALDDDARADAAVLSELTGLALDIARKVRLFHEALARRDTIGRAKGMLMERYGMEDAGAFALLRRISQERHRRLRDVAEDVVSGTVELSARAG
jgi:ANTAR domain-containing protein